MNDSKDTVLYYMYMIKTENPTEEINIVFTEHYFMTTEPYL